MDVFLKIQILPASIHKTVFLNFIHLLVGGILSPLVYLTPHPRFLSSDCLQIIQWLSSITVLKMKKFLIFQTFFLLVYTNLLLKIPSMMDGGQPKNPISWQSSMYWWGATYPSWFTLPPHPRFWNGDCLHLMKWLWSITLLKMIKISYNSDIFCFFTLISHLKYLRWWVGGGEPISAGLSSPTQIFEQWLAMDLVIAVNYFNNYKWICFTNKMDMFQILPASIEKPISWNSSVYWWGAFCPSWFIVPPTHDFSAVIGYRLSYCCLLL